MFIDKLTMKDKFVNLNDDKGQKIVNLAQHSRELEALPRFAFAARAQATHHPLGPVNSQTSTQGLCRFLAKTLQYSINIVSEGS